MPRRLKSMLTVLLFAALAIAAAGCGLGASGPGELSDCVGSEREHGEDILADTCEPGHGLSIPVDLVVSPDSRNVYVASEQANAVAVLARDPESGALVQRPGPSGCVSKSGTKGTCAKGRALRKPTGVAISPDGRNVYATGRDSSAVLVFDRDPATGALTQKAGAEGCISHTAEEGCAAGEALKQTRAIAVSLDGRQVYVASARAVAVFDRDRISGALTQKRGANGCVSENETGTTCRSGRGLRLASDLAVSRDGRSVYVAAEGSDAVAAFSRDLKTGALVQEQGAAGCVSEDGSGGDCLTGKALKGPTAVVVSPDGGSVYVASSGGGTAAGGSHAVAIFDRDRGSGRLIQKLGTAGCIAQTGLKGRCQDGRGLQGAGGIAISPDGENVYSLGSDLNGLNTFDRDQATGALTQKPGGAGCISDFYERGNCRKDVGLLGLPTGLALSPDGRSLYVLSPTFEGGVITFHRTPADGTLHTSVRGIVGNED